MYSIKIHYKNKELKFFELKKHNRSLLIYDLFNEKPVFYEETKTLDENRIINFLLRGSNYRVRYIDYCIHAESDSPFNVMLLKDLDTIYGDTDSAYFNRLEMSEHFEIPKMTTKVISLKTFKKKGLGFYEHKIKNT